MVIVAENRPLLLRFTRGADTIVVRVTSYSWWHLGLTEVICCPERVRRCTTTMTTLAEAVQQLYTELYDERTNYLETFEAYVSPPLTLIREELGQLYGAARLEGKMVLNRSSPEQATIRITVPDDEDGTGAWVPVGLLRPFVPDGTPPDAVAALLTEKIAQGAHDMTTGQRTRMEPGEIRRRIRPRPAGDGGSVKKRARLKATPGEIFLVGCVPYVLQRVEKREPRGPDDSPKWLVMQPIGGGDERTVHSSEVRLVGEGLADAWRTAATEQRVTLWLALEQIAEPSSRRTAVQLLHDYVPEESGLGGNNLVDKRAFSDRKFVLAVLRQTHSGKALAAAHGALAYASDALRADKEVVMEAVRQTGGALAYASDALRADKEVVMAAVRQNGDALAHAVDALREDKKVIVTAHRQPVISGSKDVSGQKNVPTAKPLPAAHHGVPGGQEWHA